MVKPYAAAPPIAFVAAGAAVAFYAWVGRTEGVQAYALLSILGVLVPGALLYGLAECAGPFAIDVTRSSSFHLFRTFSFALFSFALGLCVGIAAAWSRPGTTYYGQPPQGIAELSGVIVQDPRQLGNGTLIINLEAKSALSKSGVRTGAQGRVSVFLGEEFLQGEKPPVRGDTRAFVVRPVRDISGRFGATETFLLRGAEGMEALRLNLRNDMIRRFRKISGGELLSALTLGYRDDLDAEDAAAYRRAGCSHILALSGMHLGVLAALMALFLKRPLGIRGAALASCVLVCLYVLFVGTQPSLLRSGVMFCIGACAVIAGTPRPTAGILSAAFLVQLLQDPASALTLSFMLSYLALLGIITVGSSFSDLVEPYFPKFLSAALGASVGAFLATAALSAGTFGVLYPIGILSGIPAALLASALMIGSLAYLAVDVLLPVFSPAAAALMEGILRLNGALISAASRPGGIGVADPRGVLILSLAISALLVYLQFRGKRTRRRLSPFDKL